MKFTYTVITQEGKEQKGEFVAETQAEVEVNLKEKGYTVLNIGSTSSTGESKTKTGEAKGIQKLFAKSVSLEEKIQLYSNLGTMLKAGLPIVEALEILLENAKSKRTKEVLEIALYDVKSGLALSSSFSKFPDVFSNIDISMFEVGEAGGTLEENIRILSNQLQKQKDLMAKVKGAMMYPIVIGVAMVGIVTMMIIFVIPKIAGFFEEADLKLPITTRLLISLSDVLINYGIFVLAIAIAAIVGFRTTYKRVKPFRAKVDSMMLRIPFVGGLLKKLYIARFARTMSSLLKSGVPILESLEIAQKGFTSLVYIEAIKNIRDRTERGEDLSAAMEPESESFYPIVMRLVKVGTKTGTVDDSLLNVAVYYENEVTDVLGNISSIIEPVLLLSIGLAVGVLAISVLSPIYQLVGGISESAAQ